MYPDLASFMEELLRGHGCETEREGDWVCVATGKDPATKDAPAFRLECAEVEGSKADALNVAVRLGGNPENELIIREQFAIIPERPDNPNDINSVGEAFHQFATSMFHPILVASGFLGEDDPHIIKEIWQTGAGQEATGQTGSGQTATVWIGDVAVRESAGVKFEIPYEWIENIEATAADVSFEPGLNWISLYVSRYQAEPIRGFATINNQHWPSGWQAALDTPWPESVGYYGVRLFMMVGV